MMAALEFSPSALVLWGAVVAAIPATLIATATLVTALKTGRKMDNATIKAAQLDVKADQIAGKAELIHQNTNGTLSELRSDLTHARSKIDSLEKQVIDLTAKQMTLMERLLGAVKKEPGLRIDQD